MKRSWGAMRCSGGFTLIELLVVLVILGIIGSFVSISISRGLRTDAQARDRIEAFEDMQIAMERMSREIRAADPVAEALDDRIQVVVGREEGCLRFTYWMDGDDLRAREERSDADCAPDTFTDPDMLTESERILLSGLESGTPIFEYEDAERNSTDEISDTRFVRITFVRSLVRDQPDVTVKTVVGLRNS